MTLRSLLHQPLLHLLLIGGALFLIDRLATPPPPPTPILVDAALEARLVQAWQRDTGRTPTAQERDTLLRAHADEEILVREAIARGYARRDPVVRQRLIDNLRFLNPDDPRSDAALLREALTLGMAERDLVARRRLIWRLQTALTAKALSDPASRPLEPADASAPAPAGAPLIAFEHRYFASAEAAQAAWAALQADPSGPVPAGEPFLLAARQPPAPADHLAARWGGALALALQGAPTGVWTGPVASAWGWHLVRVEAVLPPAEDPAVALRQAESDRRRFAEATLRHQLDRWRPQHPLVVERAS